MLSNHFQKYFGNKHKEFFVWPEAGNLDMKDKDLSSIDYLNFAKDDLKKNQPRNIINSISNSKRAIDCKVDQVFFALGIEKDSYGIKENQKNLLKLLGLDDKRNGINYKIKILNALGIIPFNYISKMRVLRNYVEHEYILPEYKKAEDSYEEATLIVNTIENIIKKYPDAFYLFAEKNKSCASFSYNEHSHFIDFSFKDLNEKVEIPKNDLPGYIITKLGIAIGKTQDLQETFDLFLRHTCQSYYNKDLVISVDKMFPAPKYSS